jgi:hypothetical protein
MELAGRGVVQLLEPLPHLIVCVCTSRAIVEELGCLDLEKEDQCAIHLDNKRNNEIDGILLPLSWNWVLGANHVALIDVEELAEDAIPWAVVIVFVRIRGNAEEILSYDVRKHSDEL